MTKHKITKLFAAVAVAAGTLFLSVPNFATINPAQSEEAVFLTSDGQVIPAQTMGSSALIEAAMEEGRVATLFSNDSVTLYGATMDETYADDGSFTLTSDSPFTDLTYSHEEKFDGQELFHGIDVSKWQNTIDWAACKEAGVDFAIIRVGYRKLETGELLEDPTYKQNIKGALDNGINVGVYVFSQALTTKEAREEAKFLIKRVKKYDVTLPLVIDYEGGSYTANGKSYPGRLEQAYANGTVDKTSATKTVRAFCKYVKNAGYIPMIYANSNYLVNKIDGEALGKSYKIWQARYAQSTDPNNGYLYYPGSYEYWQYSDSGYIGSLKVDCNFLYKDFDIKTKAPSVSGQGAVSVDLEWNRTDDAIGYRIYRLNPDTGKYTKVGTTRDNFYTDEGLDPATEYTYKIRAYWKFSGKNYNAKYSSVVSTSTTTLPVTKFEVTKRTATTMTLGWKAVSKAKGYVIYQYNPDTDEYDEIATVKGKKNTTYKVTGLETGTEYQFIVCAYTTYDGEQLLSDDSEELFAITNPGMVAKLAVSARTTDSLTLKWTKQSGVDGYMVYRYNEDTGKWTKLGSATKNKFKDTALEAGKVYRYRVRAYKEYDGTTYYGAYSDELSTTTTPAVPTGLSITDRTKKSVTLTWNRDKNAKGYLVYRYNEELGDYEKIATIKSNKMTSYTDTGLAKGTAYEYKIRAYKVNEEKSYFSDKSEAVTVTTKK
ncbi:MAG: fibronectin type III domain-containing protein [Agathobacter sp.]|nr:fibronectin type III domain-containing protein [Agathobacter sp.]